MIQLFDGREHIEVSREADLGDVILTRYPDSEAVDIYSDMKYLGTWFSEVGFQMVVNV
jgi:hypothetical protein